MTLLKQDISRKKCDRCFKAQYFQVYILDVVDNERIEAGNHKRFPLQSFIIVRSCVLPDFDTSGISVHFRCLQGFYPLLVLRILMRQS
jgi:hypothetical protein